MPRNVRNFWLELEVDGRKERIKTGPRSKTGGFKLNIQVREGGRISREQLEITGSSDGKVNYLSVTKSVPYIDSVVRSSHYVYTGDFNR